MIDVLIADDEAPALAELAHLLRADPRIGDIVQARSGADALRQLAERAVSVAFLDIHMPGLDGFALAAAMTGLATPPEIVFVTADDARATVAELVVLPAGRTYVRLTAGDAPTRLLILGGPPAGDETVLWWGLAAPSHEGVATARADWAAQRTRRAHGADPTARFGRVDDGAAPATAPDLAGLRLRVPGPRGPQRRD